MLEGIVDDALNVAGSLVVSEICNVGEEHPCWKRVVLQEHLDYSEVPLETRSGDEDVQFHVVGKRSKQLEQRIVFEKVV